jgi:hypothetical protein
MSLQPLQGYTDQVQFDELLRAFSNDLPSTGQSNSAPHHPRKLVITLSWVAKAVLAPWQAWQWGRLVFAVMQLLQERSSLLPSFVLDSTPALAVGVAGYGMNGIAPLVLVDLIGTIAAISELIAGFRRGQSAKEQIKPTIKTLLFLFFSAMGVLYYWPVIGEPIELSNHSFPAWESAYNATDTVSALYWVNVLTYTIANALIFSPFGFSLAQGLVNAVAGCRKKPQQKEVERIQAKLRKIMQKPDLRFWYQHVRDKYERQADASNIKDFLQQELDQVNPVQLGLAALYADSRQPTCVRALIDVSRLTITFILNYGFIPFTIAVFRTLSAVTSVLSAIMSLAATATNFMLTLTLGDEIIDFFQGLSPCRKQKPALAMAATGLFLANAFILYFSSLIYLPDAFAEIIADCAFADNITNISFSANVTIPCPRNSKLWFGVQLILAVANPFLYNFALLLMLSTNVYQMLAAYLARKYDSYQEPAAWIKFRAGAVNKLRNALKDDQFSANFSQQILRSSQGDDEVAESGRQTSLSQLFCAWAYEGIPVVNDEDHPTNAGKVLKELSGDVGIELPEGFAAIKPFKTGCWAFLDWVVKEPPVIFASAYYWNVYDQENSINPTPHLPKLGSDSTVFIVLSMVWLSPQMPQLVDMIRLLVHKPMLLTLYEDSSKPLCGSNDQSISLARPMLSKLRYFGWQTLAAVTGVPLLIAVYHLAVTMLEAAIELNLHALDSEVEMLAAMAIQAFVLGGIAALLRKYNEIVAQLGLTARCNRRAAVGEVGFSLTELTAAVAAPPPPRAVTMLDNGGPDVDRIPAQPARQ